MNSDTVALVTRPYLQLVDDLLTAIAGGVVNERILYDVKANAYPLTEPATDVRSVTGTVAGEPYAFQPLLDFVFSEGDRSVVWQDGGAAPDDETPFYVDYFRVDSRSPLTDLNVGSVTRTLAEAIGREIGVVYEEINHAYRSAFIDTAEGTSLELVVAILGVRRKTAEYAEGLVTFYREAGADGAITIPEGTLLATTKGDATFVTAQPRTLQRGQERVDVPVRASEQSKGAPGAQPAGAITVMAQPLEGIARITNLDATTLPAADESDADLRERAKARLRGLGKATIAALAQAVFEGGAKLVEIRDPNGPPAKRSPLGTVSMLIEVEPERFASVAGSVHETRAAGVQATILARYVFFKPRIVGALDPGLTAAGKEKVIVEVIAALQAYVDGLGAGEPATGQGMLSAIASVKEVHEPRFADVIAWRSEVGDPTGAGLVDDVLAAVTLASAGGETALRGALERALLEAAPTAPGGRRTPDRSLVQSAAPERAGTRALDADVEAGEFRVAPVDESWWVVLDVEPADIALEEA